MGRHDRAGLKTLATRFDWKVHDLTNASAKQIVTYFKILSETIETGPLILYYSGHGVIDQDNQKIKELVGVDGKYVNLNQRFLNLEKVVDIQKIVILDMCQDIHK